LSSLAFFVIMLAVFAGFSPGIWLGGTNIYTAIAATLPTYMILASALVFVIASGEIDLSFGSNVTLTGLVFTSAATHGVNLYVAGILALLAGLGVGMVNGGLVAYIGLSSFIVTLGTSYFWSGLVNIISNGTGTPLYQFQNTSFSNIMVGQVGQVPAQLFWGVGFAILASLLFSRHKFGAYVRFAGDNGEAARQMGVNVGLTKLAAFAFVGLAAGLVGIMITLVNVNFYPDQGATLLLPGLAAVFVGGTPMFGGVGTVAGAAIGAMTISFIDVGIITSGFSGFYTNFIYGIVIVLSLTVHRLFGVGRFRLPAWATILKPGNRVRGSPG
jgi:simple sugar transport system permease protein